MKELELKLASNCRDHAILLGQNADNIAGR